MSPRIIFFIVGLVVLTFNLPAQTATEQYGTGRTGFVSLYQRYVSEARGTSCPMYPSCSQYARLAFESHRAVPAFLKTTDRLMRCGHDLEDYSKIVEGSGIYSYDPISDETDKIHLQTYYKRTLQDSSFIAFLIANKRYNEARLELWRELYKGNKSASQIYFSIGKTHFLEGDYEGLFSFYSTNGSAFSNTQHNDSVKILLTKGYLYAGRYESAARSLTTLSKEAVRSDEALMLKGLTELYLGEFSECEQTMRSISGNSRFFTQAKQFTHIQDEYENLPSRSPHAAFAMSVVLPGSGYLVSGKKGTAFSSLLINSLFAWIAIEAFQRENIALGTTATVLGSGWYIGAMIGSYNATLKWNQKKKSDLLKLKTSNLNLH